MYCSLIGLEGIIVGIAHIRRINMDIIETLIAVLFALIIKDFYDVFIRNRITHYFNSYKIMVMPKEGVKKVKKDERNKTELYNRDGSIGKEAEGRR